MSGIATGGLALRHFSLNSRIGSFLFLALSGCVADQAAIDAAKAQTRDAYYECLKSAVRQLDNGREELMTVALAVEAQCGSEWLAWTHAMSASLTPRYQSEFIVKMEPEALKTAASFVATYRTRRASASQ